MQLTCILSTAAFSRFIMDDRIAVIIDNERLRPFIMCPALKQAVQLLLSKTECGVAVSVKSQYRFKGSRCVFKKRNVGR